MVTIGIVGDLSRILEDFGSDPEVITEVFCVIACLADLGEHCSHTNCYIISQRKRLVGIIRLSGIMN